VSLGTDLGVRLYCKIVAAVAAPENSR
jgi:hypothetical protein